jgi:3',5'-cyclic AMP phosphodiesterase CpdA
VLSDLHLERGDPPPALAQADVVVLAGDIAVGTDGVSWAREWARDRPVLYLAGNHEFYGRELPGLIDELREAAAGSSVTVLENDAVEIDGVRFLGCSLWSDFSFDGAERRGVSMALCERVVNDYSQIRFGPEDRALRPRDTLALHRASRRWLSEMLAGGHDGTTVVLTHHSPVILGRPPVPHLRLLAGAFASDLSELMDRARTPLWIFGHTHRATDVDVNGTRVLSNPCGYPSQPVGGYDPGLTIEVA